MSPREDGYSVWSWALIFSIRRVRTCTWRGAYTPPKFVFMIVISFFLFSSNILAMVVQTCSTSSPSGNLVDGLPLVVNTGEDGMDPAPHP